jgi:carbonic anhydrase
MRQEKLLNEFRYNGDMHTIKACVITCIDFRFQKNIKAYLEQEGLLGEADIISIAGAAHDIATPLNKESQDYLMGQVGASISLHHPQKIILIDHQDCGMYNLSGKIPSGLAFDEDIQKHRAYLETAKKKIQDAHQQIEVELIFAGLDGRFKKLSS